MSGIKHKYLKNSGIAVALVVAGVAVGLLLLAVVYMLPTWSINYHIGESVWTLRDEGAYPETKSGEMLDNFTDSFMLSIMYNKGDTYAEDMLLSTYISGESYYPLDNLFDYITGNETAEFTEESYGRYWHGYQAVLTPLFLLFNITQIRTLNMLSQLTLIICIAAMLGMKKRADLIIPFAAMYLSLTPVALFSSFQFSSTFYVMCFLSLAVALKCDKWSFTRLCFAFEIAGVAEAYFDYLTYPAVCFGVPMILYFALDASARKTVVQRIKELVLMCASWFVGYIGMWSGKWVVASMFTDENILLDAINMVRFRSSTSQGDDVFTYGGTVSGNFYYLINTNSGLLMSLLAIMLLAWLVFMIHKKKAPLQTNVSAVAAVIISSLIPFAWYLVTINHSFIHSWFTFRELSITVYGVMTALYLLLYRREPENDKKQITV